MIVNNNSDIQFIKKIFKVNLNLNDISDNELSNIKTECISQLESNKYYKYIYNTLISIEKELYMRHIEIDDNDNPLDNEVNSQIYTLYKLYIEDYNELYNNVHSKQNSITNLKKNNLLLKNNIFINKNNCYTELNKLYHNAKINH